MQQLSEKYINSLEDKTIAQTFDLPEKVIQFGTGVLLRGLPDYFINKANKQGLFGGRVVVIKSTTSGDDSAFKRQDGLYTICVRGIEKGKSIRENIISSAISRVLTAKSDWPQVLACARQKEVGIIISNTTEVGIRLVNESIQDQPPSSFPAKLLAILFERFNAFNGDPSTGMLILPTELLPDNGKKLKEILGELSLYNKLSDSFNNWLSDHNVFASTLVDCIVPGKPESNEFYPEDHTDSYTDELALITESYRLWAIEGDERVKNVLSFVEADDRVKIVPDIGLFRELKLRLLNATHTLCSGLAVIGGIPTVNAAMHNPVYESFIRELMVNEIAPAIPYPIDEKVKYEFAIDVLDRFRNPDIYHPWINITLQYSSKIKMRVVPVLARHYELFKNPPPLIALGFAAFIRFMKSESSADGRFTGAVNGSTYLITDEQAAYFHDTWKTEPKVGVVATILGNTGLWGMDLNLFEGFAAKVNDYLNFINDHGASRAIESATS